MFLILRPKIRADKLAKYLVNQGFEAQIEPIYKIEKIETEIDFEKKDINSVIITSFNANSAFFQANLAKNVKIFTISEENAKKIAKKGYENIFFPEKSNAKEIEKLICKNAKKNEKILYFCGNYITKDFSKTLANKGFDVKNILSYKTIYFDVFSKNFLQSTKNNQKIDFVLCYSKNSAINFKKLIKNHNLLEYFKNSAIIGFSDEIVDEIKKLGFKNFDNFKNISPLKKFYNL